MCVCACAHACENVCVYVCVHVWGGGGRMGGEWGLYMFLPVHMSVSVYLFMSVE